MAALAVMLGPQHRKRMGHTLTRADVSPDLAKSLLFETASCQVETETCYNNAKRDLHRF